MSGENVRRLLGSLLDDPENTSAWATLEELAAGDELTAAGAEGRAMLAETRRHLHERGEAEAVATMLSIEAAIAGPAERGALLRERARYFEEELLDDKSAIATLDALLKGGSDPETAEQRTRLESKKARWKDIAGALKRSAEEAEADPSLVASHLVSAAGVVLQYKPKGREKEADSIFESALSIDPGNLRAVQLFERVLRHRGGRWDDLARHLEASAAAVSSPEARIELLFRAARTHAGRRSDIAAAERIYRQILTLAPGNASARRFIVAILTDRERWDDLAAFYEAQLDSRAEDSTDPGLLLQAGMTHWRVRNDAAQAEPFFKRLQAVAPEHPSVRAFFQAGTPAAAPSAEAPAAEASSDDHDVELSSDADEEIDAPDDAEAPTSVSPVAATADVVAEPVVAEPVVAEPPTPEPVAPVLAPPSAEENGPAVAAQAALDETPSKPEAAAPVVVAPPVEAPVAAAPVAANPRYIQAVEGARAAESAGLGDKAIEGWKMALRIDAHSSEARRELARLYAAASRWNNLVELLRQELESLGGVRAGSDLTTNRERKIEILREMVGIYADKLNLEPMVVQTYNALLLLEPGDVATLGALAESYERLGRWTDVIKMLEQQAEHATDAAAKIGLLRRVARLWIERFNNVNNATRPLEQIVAVDPTDADALLQLKDLYTRRRAWRSLYDLSRREADRLTGDARRDAMVELARLAAEKLGANGDAIELWREALALDPKTPGALDALEKLTERERDFAGLADVLEQRVRETDDGDQKVALLMKLGAVYGERLDDGERSVDAWHRVLRVQPKHPKALRVLRDVFIAAAQWDRLEALYEEAGDLEGLADVLGGCADRASEPAEKVALSFRAAKVYTDRLQQPARAFRSFERVLGVDPTNLEAASALVPIYLEDERWSRLAQLYEVLLAALPTDDRDGALSLLRKLQDISASRLGDRPAAFQWALRSFRLDPADAALEAQLEACAAEAGAWKEYVETLDARASSVDDPAERARLRDKCAAVEADRLSNIDAAVARYQHALEESPGDAAVIQSLDALLRRAQRWDDLRGLFDHRIRIAESPDEQRALVLEVAELEESVLAQPDAASARFRSLVATAPDDVEALAALARLAEAAGRWDEYVRTQQARHALATGADRAELALKIGNAQHAHLGRTEAAMGSFREVLSLVPHHPGALAALEALLRDELWRVVAARTLQVEFEEIGEFRKLAWALQILFDVENDADRRRELGLRLAGVYGDRLADPRSGFDLLRTMLGNEPSSEPVANALTALAIEGGWTGELAEFLATLVARPELDGAVRVWLARRTAALHEDRNANPSAAEPFHRVVIASGELDTPAFEALERLYRQSARWTDLRDLYEQWVSRLPEDAGRVALLVEEARLLEDVLDLPAESVVAYERAGAFAPKNLEITHALDRLYERLGRWDSLVALLTRGLDQDHTAEEVLDLRLRRAEALELKLLRPADALADYESVVGTDAASLRAREGLSRLLELPAQRAQAAATLETLYDRDGDQSAAGLVRMLQIRLEKTDAGAPRAAVLQRIAELREIVLHDAAGALDAIAAATLEDPAQQTLREELLRLSAMALQDARAAETLEEVLEDSRSKPVRVEVLRDLAAIYDERLIDPVKAERTFRRLLAEAQGDRETTLAAAVALERLYRALQNPRGLVDALQLRARQETDLGARTVLMAQAAEILEVEVGDLSGAVDAQRERLELDPNDADALQSLSRLFERNGQWGELVRTLRREASLAQDGDAQKALLVRAARVLEERLAAIPEAVALYEEVLATFGPDRAIHASLAKLLEISDAWPALLAVLERDLAIATEDADRLDLMLRIAELRHRRTGAPLAAVEIYQEALAIAPTNAAAREALTAMLASTVPGVALAAARALEPVLRADSDWKRLVEVLEHIARGTEERDERLRSLTAAADTAEIGLGDPSKAFDLSAQALAAGVEEAGVADRVAHVAALGTASGRHADLVAVLGGVAPQLADGDLRRDAFVRIANVALDALNDRGVARANFEKALEVQPDFLPALDALESLHEATQSWAELRDVLLRKVELAEDAAARSRLLHKVATTQETRLADVPGAIVAFEAILAMWFEDEAAQALARLYAQTSRWDELAALLESQLARPDADATALHQQLGRIAMDHQHDAERAFEQFSAVLDLEADHAEAVLGLELLARDPALAARVATLLEPIYRLRGDVPKLIGALEARIAAEDDRPARVELLARLAALFEDSVGDGARALDTYARIFREDPTDRGTWSTMDRLARATSSFAKLADVYAAVLEASSSDDDDTAELSFVTAQLFDREVHDVVRARRYYRRTLAFAPERRDAFGALEALLVREQAHVELLDLYRDEADRASDMAERKGFLRLIAMLDEGPLANPTRAIADYRAGLDVDPTDGEAITRLDALLVKTEAWVDLADLLERRIGDAVDSEERSGLRFRLGRLRSDRLGDAAGAVEAFREILDDRRDHRVAIQELETLGAAHAELRETVIDILEPVYRELDDWARLVRVLETRLEGTRDPSDRAQLLKEIGRLREVRAQDPKAAFAAFSAAFAGDPGDGDAREAIERLAAEHGFWDDLVRSYEAAIESADDVVVKTELLRAVATTHDQRRGDPRAAIVAYERVFAFDDTQIDVLDQLEGLHVLLSDWKGHVAVLEQKVSRSLDDEHRKFLLHTIGESHRDMLGNPAEAIFAFRRALDIDAGDLVSLEALDGLLVQRGDHAGLADVLQQRLDVESDAAVRAETALRLGRLWEGPLADPSRAIDAYRRAFDEGDGQGEVIVSLERLFAAQRMYPELLENLRTQVAMKASESERAGLLLRIGRLQLDELGESEAALESFREVLAIDPSRAEAITAVRTIADLPDHRIAAVEVLEPIYRAESRWEDLVAVLEHRLSSYDEASQRAAELRRIATIHETGRRATDLAFACLLRAFAEDATDPAALPELERLAAPLGRGVDLIAALESAARDADDPTVGRDLAVKAAQLSVERLRDDARAALNYRHALELAGDDAAIRFELDRIFTRSARWRDLGEVLERRVQTAEPGDLDALEVRLAELRIGRFNDAREGLSALQNVVDRDPSNRRALELLEGLLADALVRDDVMEVLDQAFARNDDAAKQAWLLGLRVEAATLSTDRVRLLGDLARLREERTGDLRGALDAVIQAFGLDPRDESLLAEIERIAPAADAWSKVRGVVEAALAGAHGMLPDEVARLSLRSARWYAEHLDDAAAAEARVLVALSADSENAEALTLLETLQRAPGRETDLVATLRRRADAEFDGDARKTLLREASQLAESAVGDLALAGDLAAAVLDVDDADTAAIDELTRLRKAQGRWEDVAELLGKRARLTDDPTEAQRLRRAVAALYVGPLSDEARAVSAWRDVLDFDPTDAEARQALEATFEKAGRWRDLEDALRSRLDVAVTVDERVETRLRLATLAEARLQSPDGAVEYLRDALDEVPDHAAAGASLERLYTSLGRWNDLADTLERRLDHAVASGDAASELSTLVRIGELHEQRLKDVERAIELYERVLERQPEHPGALAAVARLAEASGDHEKAASMLRRAVAVAEPGAGSAAIALRLATLERTKLSDDGAAEASLRRALALDAGCVAALQELRSIAEKRGDATMLAEVLEKELALATDAPGQTSLLRALATLAREKLQDGPRAIGYLERAAQLAPEDRDVLLPLVDLLTANGRERDSVPILERIIASFGARRSKELAQWQHRLGQAQERLGNKAEALVLYDAAFKVDLTSVPILRDLGVLALETGDLERAQKTFRALLLQRLDAGIGITKADVYAYLGDTLARMNDKPKAIGMLERALETDRQHARATELLAQLRG